MLSRLNHPEDDDYIPLECWQTSFTPWWLSTMKVYKFATILYVAMWYIYCQIQCTYPTFILPYSFACPWQISWVNETMLLSF